VRNAGVGQAGLGPSPTKRLVMHEARAIDESKEIDDEDDLGEDPNWVRIRTMPPKVSPAAKAQALAQQAAMPTGLEHHASPSVASTADTADRAPPRGSARSEPEDDPGADDLGEDPVWNRVHSTPAGSSSYMAPQPMFQKGILGVSGASDDAAFGPNRRATTMDQVRRRAMAPVKAPVNQMPQGNVVPVMMLVPQTILTPTGQAPMPYMMANQQGVQPMQPGVMPQMHQVQAVQQAPPVQPQAQQAPQAQQDLRQFQAQVLQAAMPEVYED